MALVSSAINKLYFHSRNATVILKLCKNGYSRYRYRPPHVEPGSYPFLKRRVPPKGHLDLATRLSGLKDAESIHADLMQPIDIGLPAKPQRRTAAAPAKRAKSSQLEEAARKGKLTIPLEEVEREWLQEMGPSAVINIAAHYNIFKDLFTEPHFFHPVVQLDLFFPEGDATEPRAGEVTDEAVLVSPVFFGNTLPAGLAMEPPHLRFCAPSFAREGLWTLVMTSPDEHLEQSEREYLHWMVANIPVSEDGVSDFASGQLVCPYLPPVPPRGTGYHRYVFVLYHHDKAIDFSSERRQPKCALHERSFSTYKFYREHEASITPGGFAFFQSTWDPSVQHTFHHVLDMLEPSFEYEWPREHRDPQVPFPDGESFDKYLDKYRDAKEINEEVLKERLKMAHPFRDYPERPKYPNAVPWSRSKPTWALDKEKQRRYRQGIWKDLP